MMRAFTISILFTALLLGAVATPADAAERYCETFTPGPDFQYRVCVSADPSCVVEYTVYRKDMPPQVTCVPGVP